MNPDEVNGSPTDGTTVPVDETTDEGQVEETTPEAIVPEVDEIAE